MRFLRDSRWQILVEWALWRVVLYIQMKVEVICSGRVAVHRWWTVCGRWCLPVCVYSVSRMRFGVVQRSFKSLCPSDYRSCPSIFAFCSFLSIVVNEASHVPAVGKGIIMMCWETKTVEVDWRQLTATYLHPHMVSLMWLWQCRLDAWRIHDRWLHADLVSLGDGSA